MAGSRWVVSLFILWHIAAIFIGSLPAPRRVPPIGPARYPADDSIAAVLTPALDTVTATFSSVPPVLWRATRLFRRPVGLYLSVTGQAQQWNMFSSSPTVDQYVRVRYYVGDEQPSHQKDSPIWVATELVFPAHREDQVRLFRSYRDSYRDKAIAIALEDFYRRRDRDLIRPDTLSSNLPDDLAPIGRYFGRRFARAHLREHERILRTEVWYGTSRNPLRGAPPNSEDIAARIALLRDYYEGPVENRIRIPPYPPYRAVEEEADIRWLLEYFEER